MVYSLTGKRIDEENHYLEYIIILHQIIHKNIEIKS